MARYLQAILDVNPDYLWKRNGAGDFGDYFALMKIETSDARLGELISAELPRRAPY